jgi:predicted MFS family arabinose efflux permease
MLGTFLFLTYFLQGTLHYSALKTGFAFLPFSGGIILGASAASKILPRSGPRNLMVTGLTMGTLGLLWFSRLGVHSTYAAHVLLPEIIVSVGMGLVFVPMNSTSLYGVDPADAGVASALVNTTQQVGGALGTAFLNTIAASATASYLATRIVSAPVLQTAAVHGYTTAFEISAGLVALSAVAAAIFIGPKRNHVLSGEGADPMSVVVEPVFAME